MFMSQVDLSDSEDEEGGGAGAAGAVSGGGDADDASGGAAGGGGGGSGGTMGRSRKVGFRLTDLSHVAFHFHANCACNYRLPQSPSRLVAK